MLAGLDVKFIHLGLWLRRLHMLSALEKLKNHLALSCFRGKSAHELVKKERQELNSKVCTRNFHVTFCLVLRLRRGISHLWSLLVPGLFDVPAAVRGCIYLFPSKVWFLFSRPLVLRGHPASCRTALLTL